MVDTTLTCPKCKSEIKLTDTLVEPFLKSERDKYEQALKLKDGDIAQKEEAIRAATDRLAEDRRSLDQQISERVEQQRKAIADEEARKARLLFETELKQREDEAETLNAVLADRDRKLTEAQQAQAEYLRKSRELDDSKRELDLTVQQRVQASLTEIRSQAKQEADAAAALTLQEREIQLAGMRRQIEDLKRRSEQGSQQLQGEAQEIQLVQLLSEKFPYDLIEPVGKGEFGGDVLQRVAGAEGLAIGTILWESKRTKNWSDGWLAKLRDDQRRAKADIALIVSHAVPKGLTSFDLIDGVWVTEPRCAIAVAIALRQSLIGLAAARQAAEGQQTKTELVYRYLTGPQFRQRIEAIVEKFADMQDDLDKERKTMTRLWAKRDAQIRGVVESTAGMYGDLQGIAGKSLSEIEGLSLDLLEAPHRE